MIAVLFKKIKEALISVLPVVAIVVLLNLTPIVNFTAKEILVFLVSAVFLIVGIGLFNMGADLAMTPMGERIGAGLSKMKKMSLLLGVCFAMGVLITVAEPDLSVLAAQVSDVINPTLLIAFVGVGVGIVVKEGGAAGGDDALALVISKVGKIRISKAYLFTDLTVLTLSLTYIPFGKIFYSLISVTLSSWIIDKIQDM